MIYFDNAATTFIKPKSVYSAIEKCIKEYCGNPGRSSHKLALKAAEAIYDTREEIASFFDYRYPERVVFTHNATYALNMAMKNLICEKCHVIISDLEHNSVLRPLNKLKEELQVDYSVFKSGAKDVFAEIESHISDNTKFIISTAASNVTGRRISLSVLSAIKQKYNIRLIIDASQLAGHSLIKLSETPCDAFIAPGHKGLFGIQGAGFIIFQGETTCKTLIEGGSGVESRNPYMPENLPEMLEAGTLSTPAIISLLYGIKYLSRVGVETIEDKLNNLTSMLTERLESINGITVYGGAGGVISFNLKGINSEQLAYLLDKKDIAVRAGLHCAPLAHNTIGTLECGTVRASLSFFNTKREIDRFYKAICDIKRCI